MNPINNIPFLIDMKYRVEEQIQLCDRLINKEQLINNLLSINNEEYDILYNFKEYVEHLKEKNNHLNELFDKIRKYLVDNCEHEWECDVIDIKHDVCLSIKYCKTCGMTNEG
jgi:hypothetical protein